MCPMRRILGIALAILLFSTGIATASGNLEFTLHKLGPGKEHALLLVAGIQGDEPGGFSAANLLVSQYRITKGAVWVVPNLNFLAIVRSMRGVYGDMNRKFAMLKDQDPDYETVRRIKAVIQNPNIDLIVNMHDGSGFYRDTYQDSMHNPLRWGQSVIIDQERIDRNRYGELAQLAQRVCDRVNRSLYDPEHTLHVKNTKTRLGDEEMAKTLTFFAINRAKAAFGVEASKNLSSALRTYYHLQMIESFMDSMGIEYERPFELTQEGVGRAMQRNVAMAFYGNKIYLDLENVRKRLNYVPLRKGNTLEFTPSNPLLTMVGDAGKGYEVYYGNRHLTSIRPQYFEYDFSLNGLDLQVDGHEMHVPFGSIVSVSDTFKVTDIEGCRINAIGYTHPSQENESGLEISHADFMKRFSVDNDGSVYRVEAYKNGKFAGMVLVRFGGEVDVRMSSHELPPASEIAVRRKLRAHGDEAATMLEQGVHGDSR